MQRDGAQSPGMQSNRKQGCSHRSDWTILAGCLGGRGSRGGMLGLFLSIFLCHFFCLKEYLLDPSKACTGRAGLAFGMEHSRGDDVKGRNEKPHRCRWHPDKPVLNETCLIL